MSLRGSRPEAVLGCGARPEVGGRSSASMSQAWHGPQPGRGEPGPGRGGCGPGRSPASPYSWLWARRLVGAARRTDAVGLRAPSLGSVGLSGVRRAQCRRPGPEEHNMTTTAPGVIGTPWSSSATQAVLLEGGEIGKEVAIALTRESMIPL